MSYDTWKTTNPADNELGRSNGSQERYRCTECDWTGVGILAASDHFWALDHKVLRASDPRFNGATDADPRDARDERRHG